MGKLFEVAEVGQIWLDQSSAPPHLMIPVVEQGGVELVLRLSQAEYRLIWEMLSALREQLPRDMGLQ
jgi:hypothetical protein